MNVSLRRLLYILFLTLLLAPSLWGQVTNQTVLMVEGTVYDTTIVSDPIDASIKIQPAHGVATLVESPLLHHNLTYVPAPDYYGPDLVRVEYWVWGQNSPAPTKKFIDFHFDIAPARVEAFHDYGATTPGTPITVDVLANDYSSRGVLILRNIPLVNNGSASFAPDGQSIIFSPDAGFEGMASLNYVVCDDKDNCDNGTVTIYVSDVQMGMVDTLTVFTKRNKSQVILLPENLTLQSGPSNGTYDDSGDAPVYSPDTDFIGEDYLTFTDGTDQTVVKVNVLDYQPNAFAFDDEVHTVPAESVEFNVLDNDQTDNPCGFHIVDGPAYGTVSGMNGQLTYTPAPGFTGLDWFTYGIRPEMCAGDEEIAKVYVFVSNYEPSASKYRMSTPKLTPVIIGYNVPIANFEFQITDQGDLGEAVFLEGVVDTTIYGHSVVGYNLILYIPDEEVNTGLDEFEVVYCVQDANGCAYQKTVKIEVDILDLNNDGPICVGDCIWAGDTNFDGVVDMKDLLPLGRYMGKLGLPRDATFSQWYGQYGNDWEEDFVEKDLNLKHLDTDGDSVVTALDTLAINLFYGNTHAITPKRIPYNEYEVQLQGDLFVEPGDLVELEMILGEDGDPAVDIYGFTFPFQYDPNFIVPESVDITYGGNSWLTYNSPILQMVRNDLNGFIESGFTRTSGVSASGKGTIGTVRFIVSDDIIGFRIDDEELQLDIGGGTGEGLNSSGQNVALNIASVTLHINLKPEEETTTVTHPDQVKVFPNPARQRLNVHLNGGEEIEEIAVHTLTGQQVFHSGRILAKNFQVDLNGLHNGLYVLTVYTGGAIINKKFEVVR